MNSFQRLLLALTAALLAAGNMTIPAPASDWGYEGPPPEIQPQKAVALPLKPAKAAKPNLSAPVNPPKTSSAVPKSATSRPGMAPNTVSSARAAAAAKSGENAQMQPTLNAWRHIYELAGGAALNNDQEARLNAAISGEAALAPQVKSVLVFWPKLSEYLTQHPDERQNYQALMKALLRYRQRNLQKQLEQPDHKQAIEDECTLIAEVLGPVRLAMPGLTPLTEDAIDAYADMACFLYEQKHPGKTIDGSDNRAVFATVVAEKFKNAPSDKDRLAMTGFDLTWAKFKIVWAQGDEITRQRLLKRLEAAGAGAAWAEAEDPLLTLLLKNWPLSFEPRASTSLASRHN